MQAVVDLLSWHPEIEFRVGCILSGRPQEHLLIRIQILNVVSHIVVRDLNSGALTLIVVQCIICFAF